MRNYIIALHTKQTYYDIPDIILIPVLQLLACHIKSPSVVSLQKFALFT